MRVCCEQDQPDKVDREERNSPDGHGLKAQVLD